MRKTTTTQTHSTTSILTWWVKSVLFGFVLFPLILVSCEETPLTIGFKKEPKNFQVFYRELPVESVTLLGDSLPTYNSFSSGLTTRFLAGTYNDPEFGSVSSSLYSQIRPYNTTKTPEPNAKFDSVTLKLRLDNYNYGSGGTTTQRYKIFTIEEEIINDNFYYNRSDVLIDRNPIGQTSVTINADYLDQLIEDEVLDTILLSVILEKSIGQKLFNLWASGDSTFIDFFKFKQQFPGVAVVPDGEGAIFGFDPQSALSELVLHYHVDTVKYNYQFYFDNVLGFSRIESDRTGTPLAGLIESKTDYSPSNGWNYIQAGVGIFSKMDFKSILALKDTVPNAAFNSVEIEIPVEALDDRLPPPTTLAIRMLNEDNSFALSNTVVYSQRLVGDTNTNGIFLANDLSSAGALIFDEEAKAYKGFITEFTQGLFNEGDPEKRFTNFALYPLQPEAVKSVNRLIFDKTKIKLKVHYTKALAEGQSE